MECYSDRFWMVSQRKLGNNWELFNRLWKVDFIGDIITDYQQNFALIF